MARVLRTDIKSVRERLKENPHLRVVHPADPLAPVAAPTPESTAARKPTPGLAAPPKSTFVAAVRDTEAMIHQGLEDFGVPKDTLEKLRNLSDMEVSTGEFLARSVIDTQTLYTIELYKIPARLEYIKKNYLELSEDKTLPPMEQMFWQRAYNELLEQLGKGKDRMIQGAEAIGAMIKDAKDKEDAKNGVKKTRGVKPGW